MPGSVFISTTGRGLARAGRAPSGEFEVEALLTRVGIRCLAVDARDHSRVYAGTRGEGILRSDDQGRSWRSIGLLGKEVSAIAASPIQSGVIYAGTKPALVFVSTDDGASWDELRAFRRVPWRRFWLSPAERPFVGYVQGIALSPADPLRILVGIEFGATLLSRDGGATWSGHLRGALRDCHSLAFHATEGDWAYEAGGTGGGASCSRDGGLTWASTGHGLDRHYGWAVAADSGDPAIWYVSAAPSAARAHGERAANAAIFRRAGDTWRSLTGGLPQPLAHMPYALVADPGAAGALYAGLSNGELWHGRDYGERWQQLPVRLPGIQRSLVML